jgi:hypothetical protein
MYFALKKVQYLVLFYAPTLIMDTDKPKIQRMQESYRNDIMTFLSPQRLNLSREI